MSHQLVPASSTHFGCHLTPQVRRGFSVPRRKVRTAFVEMLVKLDQSPPAPPPRPGRSGRLIPGTGCARREAMGRCGCQCVPRWPRETERAAFREGASRLFPGAREARRGGRAPLAHRLLFSRSTPAPERKVLAKPWRPLGPVWKSSEAPPSSSATAAGLAITMQTLTAFGLPR